MHHDDVSQQDKEYGVTKEHKYEPTDHFRIRLAEKGAPLKDKKHLQLEHYSDEKVKTAVERAKALMNGKEEKIPSGFGTYFYKIVDEILEATNNI